VTRCGVAFALGSIVACQTQLVPAARISGVVVTPEGAPIEGAFVELYISVPVGVDGGEIQELGTARSRSDGTYEIAFPETRVLINAGEKPFYGLQIVHPRRLSVATWFDEPPRRPIRVPLPIRPSGRDPKQDDCRDLCSARSHDQCQALSRDYFGSDDVCDFRY
jgi:hypothetical protein